MNICRYEEKLFETEIQKRRTKRKEKSKWRETKLTKEIEGKDNVNLEIKIKLQDALKEIDLTENIIKSIK